MADDPKQLEEAQKALAEIEAQTPDPSRLHELPSPPVAAPQPVVQAPAQPVVAPMQAPVESVGPAVAPDPNSPPGMVAPRRGIDVVRESIPNFGSRPTDPPQAMARTEADDARTTALYNRSRQQQMQAADVQGQAGAAQAVAQGEDANARLAEDTQLQRRMDDQQAAGDIIRKQAQEDALTAIAAHKELYKRDPTRWWANHNNGERIGAMLSMIGAGLQNRDAGKVLTDLVDRDTQEMARRENNLDKMGLSKEKLNRMQAGDLAARTQNIQAKHLAALDIVKDQLDAKIAGTGNLQAKANLLKARGDIEQDYAKNVGALVQQRTQNRQAESARQDVQDNTVMKAQAMEDAAFAKAHEAGKTGSLRNFQGWSGRVYGQSALPSTQYVAARETFIKELDHMKSYLGDPTKENLMRAYQQLAIMNPGARKITGSGAQLTGSEQENMDKLKGSLKSALAGEVTGVPVGEQLTMVQEAMADEAKVFLNKAAPEPSEPLPGTVFYRVLKNAQDREANQAAFRKDFDALVANKTLTPTERIRELYKLKKMGNPFASEELERSTGQSSGPVQWGEALIGYH